MLKEGWGGGGGREVLLFQLGLSDKAPVEEAASDGA